MLKFYRETNVYFKTVIWTLLVTVTLVVVCIPFFFFKLQEIPYGIALGGLVGTLYYIAAGFNQRGEYQKKYMVWDFILLALRLIIFAGALVGLALLYYKANARMFNVFAFTGGYFISLLVHVILVKRQTKRGEE
ncbi:MAG: hypothetical protein K6F07_01905 [Bacilli bacterium]|nr:hypothetical protein [Bacilli bacterium]